MSGENPSRQTDCPLQANSDKFSFPPKHMSLIMALAAERINIARDYFAVPSHAISPSVLSLRKT
jgi:hypothetical protein